MHRVLVTMHMVCNGASARVDTQMAQPERVVNECGHNNCMFSKARS